MENKTITYRKEEQEQISELTRTDETVQQKQLSEIEKTLQTLSQDVHKLQSQKTNNTFSTQDVCYQQPQQEADGGHTQGIYRKASNTQKTETPVTPTPISGTPTAHNPYLNHDRDCQRYPPERYTQWSNPYSPLDMYCDNSHRINQFTKSSIPTKLNTEADPGKADLKAQTFYHQFQAYASQYNVGLKPLADLGPDVDDYYQPSHYGMTTQEMEIERTANSRALAPKIVQAVEDQMTVDWLSSMMTTITNGYEIMKELMRQHIPSLNPATTSSAYAINPKPEYDADTDKHSFNA